MSKANKRHKRNEKPARKQGPASTRGDDPIEVWSNDVGSKLDENPLARRFLAFAIDLAVCAILSMGPIAVWSTVVLREKSLASFRQILDAGYGIGVPVALTLVGLALSIAYGVVVPWKVWPGQTLGKRVAGLEIVMLDGSPASLPVLLARQALGLHLIEVVPSIAMTNVINLINATGATTVAYAWQTLGVAFTVASVVSVFRTADHRAVHDRLAGTWVYSGVR
ncbi:MAG: RDD family protein [Olsenella sp.]|nr:RDD family protein [Olsenella sp.]